MRRKEKKITSSRACHTHINYYIPFKGGVSRKVKDLGSLWKIFRWVDDMTYSSK